MYLYFRQEMPWELTFTHLGQATRNMAVFASMMSFSYLRRFGVHSDNFWQKFNKVTMAYIVDYAKSGENNTSIWGTM